MHKAFVIGFQRNGCRRLHPNAIAAADGIACKQAVGALVEHHDAARRMPWHLADGERGSAQFNARIRADVEGAFGMKLFYRPSCREGRPRRLQILDGTYRRFRIHPYDTSDRYAHG